MLNITQLPHTLENRGQGGQLSTEKKDVSRTKADFARHGALPVAIGGLLYFLLGFALEPVSVARIGGSLAGMLAAALGQSLRYARIESRRLAILNSDWASLFNGTLRSLAVAIDARDGHGSDHVNIVEFVAREIAQEMRLSDSDIQGVLISALLLDVGTLGVPEHILLQKGRPTMEEFESIHNHPIIGSQILEGVAFPWPIQNCIRSHHERWDGTGYPDRLAGEEIPLGARILAVADVYGAVTAKRTYRSGWSHSQAVNHIRIMSGVHFDPAVVKAFLKIEERVLHNRHCSDHSSSERAAATISRVNQQFVALWEISQLVNSSLDLSRRLENVTQKIASVLDCEACAIFLKEPDGHTLVCQSVWPETAFKLQAAHTHLGDAGTGLAAYERRPIIIRQSRDKLMTAIGETIELEYEWTAIAPLRIQNTVLGTINLYRRSKEFTIDELDLLDTLARHASVPFAHASLYEATRESADRDPLTGLFNVRYFCSQMEQEVSRAERLGHEFSIIAVDLDHFKAVNDTLGHLAGDALLRDMARLFTNTVREYDSVVRYGGDEFVIILPEAGVEAVNDTVDRLISAVADYVEGFPGLQALNFSASFGAATFKRDGIDVKSLLTTADNRMYSYKNSRKRVALIAKQAA